MASNPSSRPSPQGEKEKSSLSLTLSQESGAGEGRVVKGESTKEVVIDTLIPPDVDKFPWAGHLGLAMLDQRLGAELGRERPAATEHDLRNALQALLGGRPVSVSLDAGQLVQAHVLMWIMADTAAKEPQPKLRALAFELAELLKGAILDCNGEAIAVSLRLEQVAVFDVGGYHHGHAIPGQPV